MTPTLRHSPLIETFLSDLEENIKQQIEAAVRGAVAAERERCARLAHYWQGIAVKPFESCGCGKEIAKRIREG